MTGSVIEMAPVQQSSTRSGRESFDRIDMGARIEEGQLYQQQRTRNKNDESETRTRDLNRGVEDTEGLDYPDGGFKAYLVLFGCFCGLTVCLGFINSIGAVSGYLSIHQLSNLPASTISWIFSIYLCLAYGTGIFIGSLFDKKGAFKILACSTALIFLGLMATANCVEVWQFILSFISLGVGNGIGLPPLVAVINQWFFKKRGQAIGIATCGGSAGAILFTLTLRHLYFEFGFVWAMRTVAFMCLTLMSIATALAKERITRDPKSKPNRHQQQIDDEIAFEKSFWDRVLQALDPHRLNNLDLKFCFLVTGAFMGELSLILTLTYFPSYAIARGFSESDSYLLLTVWNATGILGRWLPGYVSDKLGRFNVNIIMILGLNICLFVIWLPFGGKGLNVLYAFAALGGFYSASVLSMVPTCLAQITLASELGKKYSIVNAFMSVGNLVVIPIGASIISKGSIHDYNMFVVLVACLALGAFIFWTLSRFMIVGTKLNIKV